MITSKRLALILLLVGGAAFAAPASKPEETKVRYKAAKDVNFEQLIIEGQFKKPEMSVITGDQEQGINGLLRLRENFVDRLAEQSGEEIP